MNYNEQLQPKYAWCCIVLIRYNIILCFIPLHVMEKYLDAAGEVAANPHHRPLWFHRELSGMEIFHLMWRNVSGNKPDHLLMSSDVSLSISYKSATERSDWLVALKPSYEGTSRARGWHQLDEDHNRRFQIKESGNLQSLKRRAVSYTPGSSLILDTFTLIPCKGEGVYRFGSLIFRFLLIWLLHHRTTKHKNRFVRIFVENLPAVYRRAEEKKRLFLESVRALRLRIITPNCCFPHVCHYRRLNVMC